MIWWIVALIAIGAILVFWGIKTKNLPKVMAGVISSLTGIVLHLFKRNDEMKDEIKAKEAEVERQREVVKVHEEFSAKVNDVKIESETEMDKMEERVDEARESEEPIVQSIAFANDVIDSFNGVQDK